MRQEQATGRRCWFRQAPEYTVTGFGDFRTAGEPLSVGPRLHHGLGVGIASLAARTRHGTRRTSTGSFQGFSSHGADFSVAQQVDRGLDVVATNHGAQQFSGLGLEIRDS